MLINGKEVEIKPLSNLRWANLSRADLSEANLRGADLYGATLREANLRWADLYGADLRGANLCGADLYGADLYGANLCEADLSRADLYGADLRGANIDYSSWPMSCGAIKAIVDRKIAVQLLYHALSVGIDHFGEAIPDELIKIANTFHRIGECEEIKKAGK